MNIAKTDSQVSQKFSGEWEMKQLQDISDINPQNLSSNTNPNYKFNYISLEQVDSGRLLGYFEEIFRTAPSRAQRVLRNGDVLMSTVRPNLMAHLFFHDQVPNAVCSTGFAVLRAKHNLSDPYFLFSQLFTQGVNDQITKILAGSNYPAINSHDVKLIEIPCPPQIFEQRAIAEALSDVDGLLNALEALIAKKRVIKQAVMQQLLTGRTRLPGFSGEWETKRLGEIAPIRNHKTLPAYVNPDTLCVELDHIEQRSGQLLEYAIARNSTSSKYHFCAGDVLFGRLRPYLRKFWHADQDGICTTEIWPLMVNKDQIDSGFLYGIVQSDPFIGAASISYGTHMPRADWNVIRNFEISLPEIQEQRAIASVLFDIEAEIAALEQRRDKTRAIKQGMMQQLLTGRVRLSESRICTDLSDDAD